MTDIVQELRRAQAAYQEYFPDVPTLWGRTADEIERLRAENERLDVAPGESLRLTRTETGWEVRRLVKRGQTVIRWDRDARSGLVRQGTVSELWADAPEQDGDR